MSERQSPAGIQDPLGLETGPRIHTPRPYPVFTLQVHTLCLHPTSTPHIHPVSTPTSTHTPACGPRDPGDTQGADPAHRMSEVRIPSSAPQTAALSTGQGSGAQWSAEGTSSRPGEGREINMPELPPTQTPPAGPTCLEAPSCSGRPIHEPA